MKLATLFGRTLREAPADVEYPAMQLVLRAGLARQLLSGGYALLPLGLRAARRIETIMREELDAAGAQEIRSPILQPAELWRASGRYDVYGPLMLRLKDSGERELVLGPTHEEAFTELARREISSYRHLPVLAYQIGLKARDELRTRGGLLRLREFMMMDAYSFHADEDSLGATFEALRQAYERILMRCELNFFSVQASAGQMGGGESREFIVPSAYGEDVLVRCPGCGYAANSEVALAARASAPAREDELLREVATPGTTTIADLARLLGVPEDATAKAVFFWSAQRGLIFAVIRGDLEVSAARLALAAGVEDLRAATADEIRAAGAVPGYASPIGLRDVFVVADHSVVDAGPLVAGANREGYHLLGVTYGRDWQARVVADLSEVRDGDPCASCGAPLQLTRGVEVGHIFKLGTRYSEPLGARFLDQQGQDRPLLMGCYGLGVERLLCMAVEQHHDEAGIVWPAGLAPLPAHLIALGKSPDSRAAADRLYAALSAAGLAPLYDDRDESAGVKFADADLIGLPLRILVSDRLLREGSAEIRDRRTGEVRTIPQEQVVASVQGLLVSGS